MNFLFEFIAWIFDVGLDVPIHKVDMGIPMLAIMLWAAFANLNLTVLKHMWCIIGYTITLNVITVLLGFQPSWWWAWGWNFAFIPVFNWPKVMAAIFTASLITLVTMYNTNWKAELDKYAIHGIKMVPGGCSNWPCTKFRTEITYSGEGARRKAAKQAAQEAKASNTPPPPAAPTVRDSGLPAQMYVPVK